MFCIVDGCCNWLIQLGNQCELLNYLFIFFQKYRDRNCHSQKGEKKQEADQKMLEKIALRSLFAVRRSGV